MKDIEKQEEENIENRMETLMLFEDKIEDFSFGFILGKFNSFSNNLLFAHR